MAGRASQGPGDEIMLFERSYGEALGAELTGAVSPVCRRPSGHSKGPLLGCLVPLCVRSSPQVST